jgi:hypothetical protein
MEPQKKMMKTSCLGYIENPLIVELVSGSFGDDEQSLRIFKYFLANKSADVEPPLDTLDQSDPLWAARDGHFSVVKWLHPHKYNTNRMCDFAALGGKMDILRWLRENGYEWGPNTCAQAARKGNLECLMWARQNGCYWDVAT